MAKSQSAFRTISEVSTSLDTPTHVLRFWESKFSQIKPVKRAGGRRYYRPEDIQLLAGIKTVLHDQGMTIKGAQKLLREQGAKHVMALATSADSEISDTAPVMEAASAPSQPVPAPPTSEPAPVGVATLSSVSPVTAPPKALRPQILTMLVAANQSTIKRNAGAISPHVTQLAALRDRIRQSL
ncbi:MAG: DNA-binding transcriptional MerR regulator [Yoonia sp.]|jgi:DNA-binding transcriptional MerR regulator